jgi:DNA-binding transcriptional LysR family regulator
MAKHETFDPQLLAVFAAVARARGVSRAADQLGLSKSVVSRSIARLEAALGARLLVRTTRMVSLTELGELVMGEVEQVENAVERIHEMTGSYEGEIRGKLRVSCSAALGHIYVLPAMLDLATRHPRLEVSLHFEERLVDLVAENIDVVLRFSNLADSSLIAVKLADNPRILVAAPRYLEEHGTPTAVDDLRHHACLLYCNGQTLYDVWEFDCPEGSVHVRVRGQIRLNSGLSLVRAAVAGAGVLLVDRFVLQGELEQGELVELLPASPPSTGFPLHALYAGRGLVPSKTRAFIEAIRERIPRRAARSG